MVFFWWPRQCSAGILFGAANLFPGIVGQSNRPMVWRCISSLAWTLLCVAVARPQWGFDRLQHDEKGRDLILVLDLSLSMIADDQPDRTDRLRSVISAADAFIQRRQGDRIGLVFFASDAALSAPLTFDHHYLRQQLERTEAKQRAAWKAGLELRRQPTGLLENGTNLGLALGIAAGALTDVSAPGRAIILVTDGRDSRRLGNWVDPIVAARHARSLEQTVYCIGVGNPNGTMRDLNSYLRFGMQRRIPVTNEYLPDLDRLRDIAATGGGMAFAAGNQQELDAML
jgi:Ca-activated chloride channel family protein